MYSRTNIRHSVLLHAIVYAIFACCTDATAMTVALQGKIEECFREPLDARTSSNKFFFRFAVVEPGSVDTLDVKIQGPSGRVVQEWTGETTGSFSAVVRESGLYSFCIRRTTRTSSDVHVFLDIEFISTGSRTMTVLPLVAATIHRQLPEGADAGHIALKNNEHVGILRYDIHDISASAIHDNTRVSMLLSTEFAEDPKAASVELVLIAPNNYVEPLSWNAMKPVIDGLSAGSQGYVEVETGKAFSFEVTDILKDALSRHQQSVAFALHTSNPGLIKLFSMDRAEHDHWPILVFEDVGISTMQEIANFKERVFELRSEIQQYLHRERYNRDIAESTNSRVKWLSLLTNFVLISISVGQVVYVRKLLSTSY